MQKKKPSNLYAVLTGKLIDKQEDILKELLTFYESFYSESQQCCEKDCYDLYKRYRYQVLLKQNCPNVKSL